MKKTPPLIVIVGETASGKSSLGMEIARRFKGEIISADSWAIYKGMDIGSAKPNLQEQAEIPHHELDVVLPNGDFIKPVPKGVDAGERNSYTAAVFQANALRHIDSISKRGNLPIIVGGTGLYIDSVLFGYTFSKTGDLKNREKYNSMSREELLELIDKKGYDLTSIDVRNKRRLVRLLETEGEKPSRNITMRENTLILGITRPRKDLRKRIELRAELMFKAGLRKEVQGIVDEYGLDCEGMMGISYQEFKKWYSGERSMTQVKQDIVRNTLGLAKRQRTWFKRHPQIVWVEKPEDGLAKVEEFLV